MSYQNKFAILQFPEIRGKVEVEVAPLTWINKESKQCHWPSLSVNSRRLKIMVKSEAEPEEDWNIYEYEKIWGEFGKILLKSYLLLRLLI
jgi:hypothetical protein